MGIWLLIDYSYQLWTLNIDHNLCYFVAEYAVFMQKMLFVAVLLCDFYANCVDIMQIVLFLCKLWGFYANSAVLMQIMTFITIYTVLSQMTFLSRNTRFSRHFWACYQALITFNDVWGWEPPMQYADASPPAPATMCQFVICFPSLIVEHCWPCNTWWAQ